MKYTGSTTYQPGDTLGNTTVTLYQRDWTQVEIEAAITNNKSLSHFFDIDATVGRDVVFQADLQLTKNGQTAACSQPAFIALMAPDDNHTRTELDFTCDAANYGVFRYQLADLAAVGRWTYLVRPGDKYDSLAVTVTGKSRGTADSADPIRTRCWVSTGGQQLNTGVSLKLAVMAEVMQGNKPVIGANVAALVERPQGTGGPPIPPMEIQLLDNGGGTSSTTHGLKRQYQDNLIEIRPKSSRQVQRLERDYCTCRRRTVHRRRFFVLPIIIRTYEHLWGQNMFYSSLVSRWSQCEG